MGIIISILLLLCACSRQQERWTLTHLKTGEEAFNSSKLCYKADDPINGIDLEILSAEGDLFLYLVVHSQAIPPHPDDPKKVLVRISTEEKKGTLFALLREGRQRVLLPSSATSFILGALKQGKQVKFELPGYVSVVRAKEFEKLLKRMGGSKVDLSVKFAPFN